MPQANSSRANLFLITLAVLFGAVSVALWSARRCYESRLRQRLWPAMAPDISVLSTPPAGPARTVLLLGDSRVVEWRLPLLAHWRVVNAGGNGLTTGQVRLCAAKLLDEFRPDAVVLEAGINDLKYLGLRPEMASAVVSLALENITAIAGECEKRRCRIVLLETWPAGKPGLARRLVWSRAIPLAVDQLNAQLRSLNSPDRGIRVVDLFQEAGLKPEAACYRDTLHFKPEVYQQLTPALEQDLP